MTEKPNAPCTIHGFAVMNTVLYIKQTVINILKHLAVQKHVFNCFEVNRRFEQ